MRKSLPVQSEWEQYVYLWALASWLLCGFAVMKASFMPSTDACVACLTEVRAEPRTLAALSEASWDGVTQHVKVFREPLTESGHRTVLCPSFSFWEPVTSEFLLQPKPMWI